jgi:MOSC domain-containing protein YiiM
VGRASPVRTGSKEFLTGIGKLPVEGSVRVDKSGLVGDTICNRVHHGGNDQAVYAYSQDDYDWWSERLNRPLTAGTYGENLTIAGMPSSLYVGDRLSIGEVVIEATAPRIPCATLAAVIGDPGFGLQFRDAERPGIYFRVISPGNISAGDRVRLIPVAKGVVTTRDLFRFVYERNPDPERLRSFLDAPVAFRMRGKLESKLDSTA